MDYYTMLSIGGFVKYYIYYCKWMNKLVTEYERLSSAGKTDEAKRKSNEMYELIIELHFVSDRYSSMCTLSELKEAFVEYPKDSREYTAVGIIWDKKQRAMGEYGGMMFMENESAL